MEAFVSIHMSIFVFMPLAKMISKENYKDTFWKLFKIRVAILLFFDLFITTGIAVVDFFAVFIGAFLVVPIVSVKKGVEVVKDTLNNSISQTQENNVEILQDNSPLVVVDKEYFKSEKILLQNIIKREIESRGEDSKELVTEELSRKKNIIIFCFGLLTFISTIMYFFNISVSTCFIFEMIAFILYLIIIKKYNTINVIFKHVKNNPDEDISKVVTDVINNKKPFIFSDLFKLGLVTFIAIFIPVIMFWKPQIVYVPYGNGYAVIRYTRGFENQSKEIIIPDMYKEKNVIAVGKKAFANTSITNVKLPDSLEYLGDGAFSHCSSLIEIKIPEKVTEIKGQTFEYCTSLKNIYLHDNIISIRGETFRGAENLDNIILPSKIKEIRGNTFEGCTSLSSIIIPEGVSRIGGHAFYGCRNLSEVSIPSTITEIGSSAFRRCDSLTKIKIPQNTFINERAFKESPTVITRY